MIATRDPYRSACHGKPVAAWCLAAFGAIDHRRTAIEARDILGRLGAHIDPGATDLNPPPHS